MDLGAEHVPTGFGWQRMSCPFHDDRTPSAAVNHELEAFSCLACGVKGDAVKLLVMFQRLSHREAFDKARELAGQPKGRSRRPERKRRASDLLKGSQ